MGVRKGSGGRGSEKGVRAYPSYSEHFLAGLSCALSNYFGNRVFFVEGVWGIGGLAFILSSLSFLFFLK